MTRSVFSVIDSQIFRLYWTKVKKNPNPYKPYNDLHQCIFIKIPKTGGTSISESLFNRGRNHMKSEVYEQFDPEKFAKYFKFTFVRNPWDRFLSAYVYLKNGGGNHKDASWSARNLSKFSDFEGFVLSLQNENQAQKILKFVHFIPQYLFIYDQESRKKVDFIGRFENIENDFDDIKTKLNIDTNLLHLRKSRSGKYQKAYTKQTKEIVGGLYKEDIKLFNYKFGD